MRLETWVCPCRESTGSLHTAHTDAVSEITRSGIQSPEGGADWPELRFRPVASDKASSFSIVPNLPSCPCCFF